MATKCTACDNPERAEIDRARVKGTTLREVAQRFGLSVTALHRHGAHIASSMAEAARAREAGEVAHGGDLLDTLDELEREARQVGEDSKAAGDRRTRLLAVRERTRLAELRAKISGELRAQGGDVNVFVDLSDDDIAAAREALAAIDAEAEAAPPLALPPPSAS